MNQSSITSKGQVTIPVALRRKCGLHGGDKVVFKEENNRIYLQPVQDTIDAAFGIITSAKSATLEEMDEAVKKRAGR